MKLIVEMNNEDTKREKFQVFKNVSFNPRGIAYFDSDTKPKAVFRYYFEVLLSGHIVLQRKPLFGNRKYIF